MTDTKRSFVVTTKLGERELILERTFNAPRELVFKALTVPEHLSRWWAPHTYTIPVCKIDLRPGGVWHYCMRSPEGDDHWVRSVYQEIVRPERITYTSLFADEEANPTDVIPEQFSTMTLQEQDGMTRLIARVQLASEEALKATVKMGMVEGLTNAFTKLDAVLEDMDQQQ